MQTLRLITRCFLLASRYFQFDPSGLKKFTCEIMKLCLKKGFVHMLERKLMYHEVGPPLATSSFDQSDSIFSEGCTISPI